MLKQQCVQEPTLHCNQEAPKIVKKYFALTALCKFNQTCAYLHEGNKFLKLENELITIRSEIKALSDVTLEM